MNIFEFCVDLKEGYRPVMETEEETEVRFTMEAKNRATAERAVKALLKDATNIQEYICFCVGEVISYADCKEKEAGEGNRKMKNVLEHVKAYLKEHLPEYALISVTRKSTFPEDSHLYIVLAEHKNGTYTVWTCWNESTGSLNHGHYGMEDIEECQEFIEMNITR